MPLGIDFEGFEEDTLENMLENKWKKEFKKRKDIVSEIFDQKISRYIENFSSLKSYTTNKITTYILTTNKMPVLRSGFEKKLHDVAFGEFVNNDKLSNNIARSKSKILELALCNDFDYFFTGTIDQTKFDRNNLHGYYKSFSEWINNYNRNKTKKLKYLFIPEQHKTGEWHIHGFIKGIDKTDLINFDKLHDKIYPQKLLNKGYFDFEKYRLKFGFCSLGKIKNSQATSKYMTKYINKEMGKTNVELNAHLFYHSLNLKKYNVVGKGILNSDLDLIYDFENDYIKKVTFTDINILNKILRSAKKI